MQDPTIAEGYPAMEECGGYDAACPVSMTGNPEALYLHLVRKYEPASSHFC